MDASIKKHLSHQTIISSFVNFCRVHPDQPEAHILFRTTGPLVSQFIQLLFGLIEIQQTESAKSTLLGLLHYLEHSPESQYLPEKSTNVTQDLAVDIMRFINQAYPNVCLDTLAQQFNYHPNYISSLIAQRTGCGFAKYLQTLRLERALTLLRTTDKSIQHIARDIGYQDVRYFNKIFKARYGTTPFRFRKTQD